MANRKLAFVVVRSAWINTPGVGQLLGLDHAVGDESHAIIAPVDDAANPMGLWLSSIKTHLIRRDDAAMTLRLMIPWREVIAMGIIEDKSWAATAPIGFKTSPHVTVLTQPGSDD